MLKFRVSVLATTVAVIAVACTSKSEVITAPAVSPQADAAPSARDEVSSDADAATDGDAGDGGLNAMPARCTAACKTHLGPVSEVSSGEVSVVSTVSGVTTLFVDASAGGPSMASVSPRVYIALPGSKVAITDDESFASTAWDITLKRVDIYTNSGDGGAGKGGAVRIAKAFDEVIASDAAKLSVESERFFDENCEGLRDEASFIVTTCGGWYDYEVGKGLNVKQGTTLIVRSADGLSLYKLEVVSYAGASDGGATGGASGQFVMRVAKL